MDLHSEKGVSAVEFALVLPFLLLLTFGLIEFGILLFDKAIITNASREGARAGIVYQTNGTDQVLVPDTTIRTQVKQYANDLLVNLGGTKNNLTDTDITVEHKVVDGIKELWVTVRFTYDFLVLPNMSSLVGGDFDGTLPMSSRTIMRME